MQEIIDKAYYWSIKLSTPTFNPLLNQELPKSNSETTAQPSYERLFILKKRGVALNENDPISVRMNITIIEKWSRITRLCLTKLLAQNFANYLLQLILIKV